MEVVQSIGAPLDAGFRQLRLQELDKQRCMIDRSLGVLPKPPAQTCCSTPMALFMRIGTSQVSNWPYNFQSAMEVQWQLLMLWDIQRYAQDGFLKVSQPSTDVKGKPSVLNCLSILMLRRRPFCPGLSQVTKPGLTIMSWRRKGSQWSGIIRNHKKKVQNNSFRQEVHDHHLLGYWWSDSGDVMARGETIKSGAYIKTLQKLKQRYQWVRPNRNPGDMLIQHNNARPHTSLWTQEAITKSGWTVLPHPPYTPDLAPSDFHLFGPLKDALHGTRFEDDENVIQAVRTWLCEQETSWYREGMCALVLHWRKAVYVDGDYLEK